MMAWIATPPVLGFAHQADFGIDLNGLLLTLAIMLGCWSLWLNDG